MQSVAGGGGRGHRRKRGGAGLLQSGTIKDSARAEAPTFLVEASLLSWRQRRLPQLPTFPSRVPIWRSRMGEGEGSCLLGN